jgi:diacylglycerol O-acyltransferase
LIRDPFGSFGDDYLPSTDNAWLRMDGRTNRMVVTGVLSFEESITYEEIKERFEERLLLFDRFRQRLVEPWHGLRPRWEEDPLFDLNNHLTHVALPEPGGKDELQEFVGDVIGEPLDYDRPLWHCWLVEGGEGDGNALVVRIHHALADGFALLYVLFSLADDPDSIELPFGDLPPLPGDTPEASASEDNSGGFNLSKASETLLRGAEATVEAVDSVPLRSEPKTPLSGDPGTLKRAVWTQTYSLDKIKSAAGKYDATVNDVLMAVSAGAFRRYLESQGYSVPRSLELRTAMPINLKPLQERDEQLGNYFGLGFVELPVGIENLGDRTASIQERTGELKQGTEAYGMYSLLTAVGSMPDKVQDAATKVFRDRVTAVVTNVPGPLESIEIAGTEVNDIMFWAPTTEDIGLGISIFSYDGGVSIGIASDDNVVSEPDALADAFDRELEELVGRARDDGSEDRDGTEDTGEHGDTDDGEDDDEADRS